MWKCNNKKRLWSNIVENIWKKKQKQKQNEKHQPTRIKSKTTWIFWSSFFINWENAFNRNRKKEREREKYEYETTK